MDELMFNPQIKEFFETINELSNISEDELDEVEVNELSVVMKNSLGGGAAAQAVKEIINNLESQGVSKQEAKDAVEALKKYINEKVYGEKVLGPKQKQVIDEIMNTVYALFDRVTEMYHTYAIELPMKLEDGAQVPTYAHDTDACADLYALEDVKLDPESYGNKIRTGVSIQLPEGWLAMIFPRSSIGAKTTLRLSNSVGIIDSGYRGELGVLFDNTSHGYVDIHKGDRVAQLLVMPSYRFKANVVDELTDSDRGTGGFGSSGT